MKKDCFVGFDTSNYTTSIAVCDMSGEIVANFKTPLPVKEGERGLRQSDALFAHTKNLPALADKLSKLTVKISAPGGTDGRLYGSVTSKDIAEGLKSQHKVDIDKRKLVLNENIKTYGTYEVEVKVYPEVSTKLKVSVTEGK